MFSDNNEMKVEINNRKMMGKILMLGDWTIYFKVTHRVFLVAQWYRIQLPLQETQVWSVKSEKIPHATQQVSLCTTTIKPVL